MTFSGLKTLAAVIVALAEEIMYGTSFRKTRKLQGGSDKSGVFFFFLLNGIKQLKISRFY
jgi:hypothetical protein